MNNKKLYSIGKYAIKLRATEFGITTKGRFYVIYEGKDIFFRKNPPKGIKHTNDKFNPLYWEYNLLL